MDTTHIKRAIETVQAGGIIIYPTDTAFGIGCRIDDPAAVDRLFSLRNRPITQATPVLVSSIDMALAYLHRPSHIVRHYMNRYWPGALTIIAACQISLIHSPIRGGGQTIGVRMPDHETALAIIAGVGVPLLGPSANFHKAATPYTFDTLDPKLCELVDYVVPGQGKVGMASTVVDTLTAPPTVVRQGSVVIPTVAVHIDTTDIHTTSVRLIIRGTTHEERREKRKPTSQILLPLIMSMLAEHSLTLSDITDVSVAMGPGSFTGLRVGVAVANTLGHMLNIPVNGTRSLVLPTYS